MFYTAALGGSLSLSPVSVSLGTMLLEDDSVVLESSSCLPPPILYQPQCVSQFSRSSPSQSPDPTDANPSASRGGRSHHTLPPPTRVSVHSHAHHENANSHCASVVSPTSSLPYVSPRTDCELRPGLPASDSPPSPHLHPRRQPPSVPPKNLHQRCLRVLHHQVRPTSSAGSTPNNSGPGGLPKVGYLPSLALTNTKDILNSVKKIAEPQP